MKDSADVPTATEMLEVFSLAQSPSGDTVIGNQDSCPLGIYRWRLEHGDRSCKLLSYIKCFAVYGSFLASDPAASLVNLEACTLIE